MLHYRPAAGRACCGLLGTDRGPHTFCAWTSCGGRCLLPSPSMRIGCDAGREAKRCCGACWPALQHSKRRCLYRALLEHFEADLGGRAHLPIQLPSQAEMSGQQQHQQQHHSQSGHTGLSQRMPTLGHVHPGSKGHLHRLATVGLGQQHTGGSGATSAQGWPVPSSSVPGRPLTAVPHTMPALPVRRGPPSTAGSHGSRVQQASGTAGMQVSLPEQPTRQGSLIHARHVTSEHKLHTIEAQTRTYRLNTRGSQVRCTRTSCCAGEAGCYSVFPGRCAAAYCLSQGQRARQQA